MTREEGFDPKHLSVKPRVKQAAEQPCAASPSTPATCAA
jgi:hypothetical protein